MLQPPPWDDTAKGHLDLDLSSDPELSAAFEAAVAEGGRDSLCAVLRRCAERPSALSIARTDDGTLLHLAPGTGAPPRKALG